MSKGRYKRTITHCRNISKAKRSPIGIITQRKYRQMIKVARHQWMTLHRYKVEKYIGYKLKKGWIIHHIDGNPLHNRLFNLYIFKNKGLHLDFEILVKANIINRFS